MPIEIISGIFGMAGTILGALITVWMQYVNNRAKQRSLVEEHRIQEYLSALDYACDAADALTAFGRALSGRSEPDDDAPGEEIEDSKRRDREASEALESSLNALRLLSRQSYRISAIGSKDIKDSASAVIESVDGYFRAALARAQEDGMFIAKDFNQAMNDAQEKIKGLTITIRSDLGIDNLYRSIWIKKSREDVVF